MIGQFKGRQKTNVYGRVSDLAVARSGFNQIANVHDIIQQLNHITGYYEPFLEKTCL